MRFRKSTAGIFALLLTATACIDDPAAVSGDALPISAAEAEILGVSVWRDIMTEGNGALDNATNVTELIDFVRRSDDGRVDIDLVLDEKCEYGGDRIVEGIVKGEADAAGNGFVEVEIIHDWEECTILEGDLRAIVEGEPNVDSKIRYDFTAGGELTIEGRMEGRIVVIFPDGRSGSCDYAVTFSSAESQDGQLVFRKKGIVCNEAVNVSVVL